MAEELIQFDLPVDRSSIIKVIGVGGGGSNAVNHMCRQGIRDVNFVVCNTDAQALANSPVSVRIQLGPSLTEGRGAGNKPEVGRQAAIENLEEINDVLASNTKMVFITAGMGGGTGTGAAPIIAKAARDMGILTVGIVTIPFRNEGQRRIGQAMQGIQEIEKYVDSLLIINNERIREMYGDLKVSEAFARADNVLTTAAKGIAEIITVHGYINVDFADVETVMRNSGVAIMGSGEADGDNRAIEAVKAALNSPLLNNNDIRGAKNILLNITSGNDEITMDEIGQITDYIQDASGANADLIWGNGIDPALGSRISVTVIATGFLTAGIPELYAHRQPETEKVPLADHPAAPSTTPKPSTPRKTEFIIKDREPAESAQRVIEFDLRNGPAETFSVRTLDNTPAPVENEADKAGERLNYVKRNYTKSREIGYNTYDERNNIEELENQPAYLRKKVKLEEPAKPDPRQALSRYSLFDDEEMGLRIKPDNSYLHDNVD